MLTPCREDSTSGTVVSQRFFKDCRIRRAYSFHIDPVRMQGPQSIAANSEVVEVVGRLLEYLKISRKGPILLRKRFSPPTQWKVEILASHW
jgi:hypothetical protein